MIFFIHGQHVLYPCLHSFFNKLLRAGYFPGSWAEGHAVSLHKMVTLIMSKIIGYYIIECFWKIVFKVVK